METELKTRADGSELIPENYMPHKMRIEKITQETPDVKTFKLVFCDEPMNENFTFKAGQFGLYSIFGAGECVFCVASSPTRKGYIECSVKLAGKVTGELHRADVGDIIGFRGPYGNWFPIDEMKGKDLLFVGGGIGLAPLRSLIWNCLDLRDQFGNVTIVYGSRSVDDLVYKDELQTWEEMPDVKTLYTVDPSGETPEWDGEIGFVPTVLSNSGISPDNTIVITCGPPIMIKFVLVALQEMGFSPDNAYTTLENRMKCGIGKCGRCNIGNVYVCKDGPVFRCSELQTLPQEF
ncbi:FAD/NAD(P)-binding protein [Candidatus Hydrogenedentota bacterium]